MENGVMSKTSVSHCPFCGKGWVRCHNSCPKQHKYFENESMNEYVKVFIK